MKYTKRIVFGSKDYRSKIVVIIAVFTIDGNLVEFKRGIEIDSTGIYYADFELDVDKDYVVIAYEPGSKWKAHKYIEKILW